MTAPDPPARAWENTEAGLARYQHNRRMVGAVVVAALLCLVPFLASAHPQIVQSAIEQAGTVLIAFGVGGRLWCTLYIGGRKDVLLVDQGPYSVSRNPLYFFSTVAAAGVGAQMGSVVAMVGCGLLCAAAFHFVMRREEHYLAVKMGAAYADYAARVPRFLPDFRLYREDAEQSFWPGRLRQTFLDGVLFLLALPLFYVVGLLQDAGTLPVLVRLW